MSDPNRLTIVDSGMSVAGSDIIAYLMQFIFDLTAGFATVTLWGVELGNSTRERS
jgi:hypothetical protein